MNWLSWLLGKSDKGAIEQLSDGVGQFIHTGEEKAQETAQFESEVTQRWKADSEAPITRLVRPVSYLFVTFCTFTFGALDASLPGFNLDPIYIEMYRDIYVAMTLAYFGIRGYEKISKYRQAKK